MLPSSNWSKELGIEFGDSLVSDLLRRVSGSDFTPLSAVRWQEDIPFFEQFRNDLRFQWTLLRSVLAGGHCGKLNAKLLTVLLWTASEHEEWPKRTVARLIYAARDDKELANLVALVTAVLPHLCQHRQQSSGELGLLSGAVWLALAEARRIGREWDQFVGTATTANATIASGENSSSTNNNNNNGFDSPPLHGAKVVENVLTLIRWQQTAPEDSPIRHMGISLPDLRGQLQDALLGWALDYVDSLLQQRSTPSGGGFLSDSSNKGTGDGTTASTSHAPPAHLRVLDTFYSLMCIVVPQVQLPFRYHNKLLTKICALIVSMLRLVDRSCWGTADDGVDFVCRCFAISGKFFTAQIGTSKMHLLAALVDEVFGSYDTLFDTDCADASGIPCRRFNPSVGGGRDAGAHFNFDAFRTLDFVNTDRKTEHSLLRDIRHLTMEWRSAAEVAHNGTLPRRRRRADDDSDYQRKRTAATEELRRVESAFVRRLLFLNMVENLCAASPTNAAANGPYETEMCRFLGQLLVDRFGGDGLTSHFSWLDWEEHERELSPQYLIVSQQIDRCPLLFDLLLLLSSLGFNGLFFCLPLIKAQFVNVLSQLECTPLKELPLSAAIRHRCTQLFALFISADFFPDLANICVEMLCHATNHEMAVLMRDLWNFVKLLFSVPPLSPSSIHPSSSSELLRPMPPPSPNRMDALNSKEGRLLTSSLLLIGQRHITSMGPLLANLVDLLTDGDGIDGAAAGDDDDVCAMAEDGEAVDDEWAIERLCRPTAIPTTEIRRVVEGRMPDGK